jgi:hypothetical protein
MMTPPPRSIGLLVSGILAATVLAADKPEASQTPLIPKEDLGQFVVSHLDLTTFRNSLSPQRKPGMRHFADLGLKPSRVSGGEVEFDSDDWRYVITVLERADKNGDGLEDLVVRFEDRAKKGSYAGDSKLLLTRFTATGDLIALAFEP